MRLVTLTGWAHDESEESLFDGHVIKPADLSVIQAVLAEARPGPGAPSRPGD